MQGRCRLLARADVADDAGDEPALATRPLGEREFQRELIAVLAHPMQFNRLAEDAGRRTRAHALHTREMSFAVTLRYQQGHRLPHGLNFRVAENDLGAVVPADNISRAVGGDDGFVGGLRDRPAAQLALAQGFLTFAQSGQQPIKTADQRADLIARGNRQGLQQSLVRQGRGQNFSGRDQRAKLAPQLPPDQAARQQGQQDRGDQHAHLHVVNRRKGFLGRKRYRQHPAQLL